jgi:hypothetical protein
MKDREVDYAELTVEPGQHTQPSGAGQPSDRAATTPWQQIVPWLVLIGALLLLLVHVAFLRWALTRPAWLTFVRLVYMSWSGTTIAIGGWLTAWAVLSNDRTHARHVYGWVGTVVLLLIIGIKNNWHWASYLDALELLDVAICTAVVAIVLRRRDFELTAANFLRTRRQQPRAAQFTILDVFILTTGNACLLGVQLVPRLGVSDRWLEITLAVLVPAVLLIGLADNLFISCLRRVWSLSALASRSGGDSEEFRVRLPLGPCWQPSSGHRSSSSRCGFPATDW